MVLYLIEEDHRGLAVIRDHHVETTIEIQIGDADPPAVLDGVGTQGKRDVGEPSVALIPEEAVVLVTVPGVLANEFMAEEGPLLVPPDVCDRTTRERQSQIGMRRGADPAVGDHDVESRIVVEVEE